MKKLLIIQNKIPPYRKGFYNELSKSYDVTILHSGERTFTKEDSFNEIISNKTIFLSLNFQHKVLSEINKDYNVVIAMFDLHWCFNFIIPYILNKNSKFIWWGQWQTNKQIIDKLKIYISNKKNVTSILYTESEKLNLIKHGAIKEKLFVANNTLDVGIRPCCFKELEKNTILFVGSLDKRKQLDVLIIAFNEILSLIDDRIVLVIIGDGEEIDNLLNMIKQYKLQERVFLKGKITLNEDLVKFYKRAIVNVSFGQAGLSVLQSFGYGVPFITKVNAISGGEKTNIINGHNGFLCQDSLIALKDKLVLIVNDDFLARKMGENAYIYYSEKCTIKNMAEGFINTIESR